MQNDAESAESVFSSSRTQNAQKAKILQNAQKAVSLSERDGSTADQSDRSAVARQPLAAVLLAPLPLLLDSWQLLSICTPPRKPPHTANIAQTAK